MSAPPKSHPVLTRISRLMPKLAELGAHGYPPQTSGSVGLPLVLLVGIQRPTTDVLRLSLLAGSTVEGV